MKVVTWLLGVAEQARADVNHHLHFLLPGQGWREASQL